MCLYSVYSSHCNVWLTTNRAFASRYIIFSLNTNGVSRLINCKYLHWQLLTALIQLPSRLPVHLLSVHPSICSFTRLSVVLFTAATMTVTSLWRSARRDHRHHPEIDRRRDTLNYWICSDSSIKTQFSVNVLLTKKKTTHLLPDENTAMRSSYWSLY